MQARLELVFLMTLIFLGLLLLNRALSPMKRTIRRRGFFALSITVSTVLDYLVTRLLSLTPVLGDTPVLMIIASTVFFQWVLYICVVALKRCFTLGEMCVLAESVTLVVHGALEYILATVSGLCMTAIRLCFLRTRLKRFVQHTCQTTCSLIR